MQNKVTSSPKRKEALPSYYSWGMTLLTGLYSITTGELAYEKCLMVPFTLSENELCFSFHSV